ncbi:helicase-associated domain-containing protein [Microbacterium sp. SD291]|uniref:helicase-associated domain-containing protein n=1 Tax=Microbacterium sp. SD291 TaxID=2782007 RepID=UPI001A9743C4|nr:helicase-associated domain-containing protein [Microbacterium sp. SD291]MBO0980002.1 helicase-associated domain-containing protein [Microbacterium sp. SD291]
MSTHARPLAEWLAAASDADLAALFAARGVRADATWQDFFDSAEALLDAASVTKAVQTLTGAEASALLRAASGAVDDGPERATLTALGLLRPDGAPWPPVAAIVTGRPLPEQADELTPAESGDVAAAHAAERAFTTVSAIADLLLLARERPFSLLAGGNISAGEKRQLVEAGMPTDSVDPLIAIALAARLAVVEERRLRTTTRAEDWLRASVAERWRVLVTGFRDALPRGVRRGAGWTPVDSWPLAHPWDPAWADRSSALMEHARLLGLTADDDTEPAWSGPVRRGEAVDATALTELLPVEVDRIFLQNDLTAIAPGPLAPALDVRLRTVAARESAAQASSYRFTSESIAHGLVVGETETSILDFLETLSLTGIPQPLRYLVSQTAQRHGLVRVSTDAETGRTRIESADHHLIEALAVDQGLRPLALAKHVGSLSTRVGRDTVYWALTDARYPATLVDEDGAVITGDRHPLAEPAPAPPPDHTRLITALRAHQGPDADAAWLDRELEAAVRARAVLRVTVGMPDGSTRELLLEATGLGGGRLRGRDRAADVERTLPVSSIRAASIVAP